MKKTLKVGDQIVWNQDGNVYTITERMWCDGSAVRVKFENDDVIHCGWLRDTDFKKLKK